jgi:hypothetical protein
VKFALVAIMLSSGLGAPPRPSYSRLATNRRQFACGKPEYGLLWLYELQGIEGTRKLGFGGRRGLEIICGLSSLTH